MMKSLKEAERAGNVPAVAVERILTPRHCPPQTVPELVSLTRLAHLATKMPR